MGYWTSWGSLPVANIPADKLTHVLYAFSDVNAHGQCASLEGNNAAEHMLAFKRLKTQYPHLKILVSLGGWGASSHFSANSMTSAGRGKLIKSCIDLWIKGIGMAGEEIIDVDWEYPGSPGNTNDYSPSDKENFVALMQGFRDQLDEQGAIDGKHYSLSAAFGTTTKIINNGYDLSKLAPLLDFFNLMTYDFHGSWDHTTNFHSNLYAVDDDPSGSELNIDAAVERFSSGGVPKDKIVVGVPFYGRGWKHVPDHNHGLFQAGELPFELGYEKLKSNYESNSVYAKTRHPQARVVSLYNATDGIFISYDDPESAADKARYIVNHGLAGAMFWELSGDDSTFSMTHTLSNTLGINLTAK
jgi:chitinase